MISISISLMLSLMINVYYCVNRANIYFFFGLCLQTCIIIVLILFFVDEYPSSDRYLMFKIFKISILFVYIIVESMVLFSGCLDEHTYVYELMLMNLMYQTYYSIKKFNLF